MNHAPAFFIVGLGSQAKAWALNLRDSGYQVTLGLRAQSPSIALAHKLGLETLDLAEDFFHKIAQSPGPKWVALLIPDHEIAHFFNQYHSHFQGDESFLLAHGASYQSVHQKFPAAQIGLLAPKAIASELRFRFETKGALGAAIAQGSLTAHNFKLLPRLCLDLGINAGPFEVTIEDETNADLFSEQALLCGLLPYAFRASFELLRAKGIPEELAFMECWVEGQLISNTLCEKGPQAFFELISPNALVGAHKAQSLLIDESFKAKLEKLWSEIEDGQFLSQAGQINVRELRQEMSRDWSQSPLSQTFHKLQAKFYPHTEVKP